MHLPPPPLAPTSAGRPWSGRHPLHRKNRERRRRQQRRGVKRRREREKKERCASHTHSGECACARREGGRGASGTAAPITITWRAATALPTAAARATTRPLHHAACSCDAQRRPPSLHQSILASEAGPVASAPRATLAASAPHPDALQLLRLASKVPRNNMLLWSVCGQWHGH